MACLEEETVAALARGVIPRGASTQIHAHLPVCASCREAVARAARVRRDDPRLEPAPHVPEPPAAGARARETAGERVALQPSAPWFVRWGAMFVAAVTLAFCMLWAAPDSSARARLESGVAQAAGVARSALDRVEWQRLWWRISDELRAVGVPGLGEPSERAQAAVRLAPDDSPPSPDELAAAAARLVEASKHIAVGGATVKAPSPDAAPGAR